MILSLMFAAIGLLYVGQTETVQFFGGVDGCYGGTEWLLREAVEECLNGDGDWGPIVSGPVVMECYREGAMYHRCGATVEFYVTFDADQDGDVDLADFGRMQIAWTGPR